MLMLCLYVICYVTGGAEHTTGNSKVKIKAADS